MSNNQKEQLSSLMDEHIGDDTLIDQILSDDKLIKQWHRYHLIRDVMQDNCSYGSFNLNMTSKIEALINDEPVYGLKDEPKARFKTRFDSNWFKSKNVLTKISQISLAACVTLAVIIGVRTQNEADEYVAPAFNTMPVGVTTMPVGGLPTTQEEESNAYDQQDYNKIQFLIQDYELQKRLINSN